MKYLTSFIVLLFFCTQSFGQKSLKTANKYYEAFEYSTAISHYKVALKKKKDNKEAVINLADCYLKTSNFEKAAKWFEKAIEISPNDANLKFQYGEVLMSLGQYTEAKMAFVDFAQQNPNDSRAERFIEWCNNVDSYLKDSSLYEIASLPLNSRQSDFGPNFYEDGLIFASARPTGSKDKIDGRTGQTFLDLFFASQNSDGRFSEAKELPGWNKSKFHDGPATICMNNTKMYFTRNVRKKFKKNKTATIRIFESTLEGNQWSNPVLLPFNPKKSSYSLGHPTASEDGNIIYYTADIPGGFGGKDIYSVEKIGGVWGEPVNLGKEVNTEGDEMFPFIHSDGSLYFASDGHGGFGSLDVFYVFPDENNEWSAAKNMGYPINSPKDDFGLILNEDKTIGYISSNRTDGKGSDDIYVISIKPNKARELKGEEPVIVEGTPFNENQKNSQIEEVSYSAVESTNPEVNKRKIGKELKNFYFIGIVQDYNSKEEIGNQKIELVEVETKKSQNDFADKLGNFYFHLRENYRYVLFVRNEYGEVEDHRAVSVYGYDKGNIFHAILEVNKPRELAIENHDQFVQEFGDLINIKRLNYVPNPAATIDTFEEKRARPQANPNPKLIPDSINNERALNDSMSENIKSQLGSNIDTSKPQNTNSTLDSSEASTTYFDKVQEPQEKFEEYRRPEPAVAAVDQVEYKIQVGSFLNRLPASHSFLRNIADEYDIELGPNGLNRYVLGSFDGIDNAKRYLGYVKSQGYGSAFIAIYVNGRRQEIGLNDAPSKWLR